jgi:3'-phosphoadenosine 5'-phosphosulfate (PAPS) 3'-phosphatase
LHGEQDRRRDLDAAVAAALAGGAIVREFYDGNTAATYAKGDGSPVTDADLASDQAIRQVLKDVCPDDPILSEEGLDDDRRLAASRCWIVDPIDGTEQFIHRSGEFDVLVALIENGRPVVAAGYQPTTELMVTAVAGEGAWVRRGDGELEQVRFEPAGARPRLATSKWFGAPENGAILQSVADRLGIAPERSTVTGFSPRMFLTPRALDVMIGIRPTGDQTMAFEWDFAVGDLVFHEAGGMVTDLAGEPFWYNKPLPHNVNGLVAAVDPESHARALAALRDERAARKTSTETKQG